MKKTTTTTNHRPESLLAAAAAATSTRSSNLSRTIATATTTTLNDPRLEQPRNTSASSASFPSSSSSHILQLNSPRQRVSAPSAYTLTALRRNQRRQRRRIWLVRYVLILGIVLCVVAELGFRDGEGFYEFRLSSSFGLGIWWHKHSSFIYGTVDVNDAVLGEGTDGEDDDSYGETDDGNSGSFDGEGGSTRSSNNNNEVDDDRVYGREEENEGAKPMDDDAIQNDHKFLDTSPGVLDRMRRTGGIDRLRGRPGWKNGRPLPPPDRQRRHRPGPGRTRGFGVILDDVANPNNFRFGKRYKGGGDGNTEEEKRIMLERNPLYKKLMEDPNITDNMRERLRIRQEALGRRRRHYFQRGGRDRFSARSNLAEYVRRRNGLQDDGGNSRVKENNFLKIAKNTTSHMSQAMKHQIAKQEFEALPIRSSKNSDAHVDALVEQYPADCKGKEHMLRQLRDANIKVTQSICQRLPNWSEVEKLYGPGPVVLGLETCDAYKKKIRQTKGAVPQAAIAGLWNSGTTALSISFLLNFVGYDSEGEISDPTVPWGKHSPFYLKYENTYPRRKADMRPKEAKDLILPVLIVRDPFRWMRTMCKKSYDAHWDKGLEDRCPNFIPTRKERQNFTVSNTTETYEVLTNPRQAYYRYWTQYESLAELWSHFNEEYLYSDLPRLIIRAEDTFFYPRQVMQIISECSGMPMKKDGEGENGYSYMTQKSKDGSSTNWLQAMERYGHDTGRFPTSITNYEKRYLQKALSPDLMRLLHYPQIPVGTSNTTTTTSTTTKK